METTSLKKPQENQSADILEQSDLPESLNKPLSIVKRKTEGIVNSTQRNKTSQKQKKEYASVEDLRSFMNQLKGKKFKLDCGHHVTFGYFLGNDIVVLNGKEPIFLCSDCFN